MRKLVGLACAVLVVSALAGAASASVDRRVATKTKTPPVALAGTLTNKGTVTASQNRVSIEADDNYFKATFVKAKPGKTLTVKVRNEGKVDHTFTVPGQAVDAALRPAKSATVKVTVPSDGAVLFYCRMHGPNGTDGDLGMQGAVYTKADQPVTNEAAAKPTVKVADSRLGKILVNGDGATLYQRDSDTPTQVTCTGACATVWPPAIVADKPVAGAGIDPTKLGTINGPNGLQATYGGHPLYRFANDRAPGDTNGQGFANATWWVLGPDGQKITRT